MRYRMMRESPLGILYYVIWWARCRGLVLNLRTREGRRFLIEPAGLGLATIIGRPHTLRDKFYERFEDNGRWTRREVSEAEVERQLAHAASFSAAEPSARAWGWRSPRRFLVQVHQDLFPNLVND